MMFRQCTVCLLGLSLLIGSTPSAHALIPTSQVVTNAQKRKTVRLQKMIKANIVPRSALVPKTRTAARITSKTTATISTTKKNTSYPTLHGFPSIQLDAGSSNTYDLSATKPIVSDGSPLATIAELRRQVLLLTNIERSNVGLGHLTYNVKLEQAAQKHVEDMQQQQYFSHISPSGKTPSDRIQAAGYLEGRICKNCQWQYFNGENIAVGQQTPEEVVRDWMNSPAHKANLLNPNFDEIGIGYVARNPNATDRPAYWDQTFGSFRVK